jgi:hypothetical protein
MQGSLLRRSGSAVFSFLTWLVGPGIVIPALLAILAAVGGVVGGLPWIVVALLVLAALTIGLALLGGALVVLDRLRPLARVHLAEDEIGRIVDEGQDLKSMPIHGERPVYYEVKNWWDSASLFIEAVFGRPERDRFMRNLDLDARSVLRSGYDDEVEARCNRLRDLARRLGGRPEAASMIRVSRRKMIVLGKEQQDEAAKSPISDLREVTVPESGEETEAEPTDSPEEEPREIREPDPAPVEPEPEPEPDVGEDQERRPVLRPGMGVLEGLYVEGRKMEQAALPFSIAVFPHRPKPTEVEIDRWQGKVRAALPLNYRRRFRFAPLEAEARRPFPNLAMGVGFPVSKEAERLRESLGELKRIMEDMDYP